MTGILITLEQNLNWMKSFQNLKRKSELMQTEKLSKTEMVAKDVLIPIKSSLLINQGEDYLVVKERLGHASITTTIDTYSHLYPSKQKTLANKLDDLF